MTPKEKLDLLNVMIDEDLELLKSKPTSEFNLETTQIQERVQALCKARNYFFSECMNDFFVKYKEHVKKAKWNN